MRKAQGGITEGAYAAFPVMPQDAGISKMPGYKAYDEGNAAGIWIRDYKGQPYVGQVRCNNVTW